MLPRHTTGIGFVFGAVLALGLCTQALAAPLGTVTIMDGRAHLARGTTLFTVAEGGAVEEGDVIDLEDGALLQIELSDNSAISFAGKGRVFLPTVAGPGRLTDVLLLGGWAKFNLASAAQVPAVRTPQLRLISQAASYVLQSAAESSQLFVESGELVPVFASVKPGQPAVVKANEYLGVKADATAATAGRAPPAFVKEMPKAYLDKLPQRLTKLKARGVELKPERELTFAEVDGIIQAYPAGRAMYLPRFQPLLQDAAFVRDLQPVIKSYPEWDKLLRAEKSDKSKSKAKGQQAK